MSTFKVHCIYNLIIASFFAFCLYQRFGLTRTDPAVSETKLHQLIVLIHEAGLPLRVVAQCNDMRWHGPIYLTQTDLNGLELQDLPISPAVAERWTGTVIVFNATPGHDTSDWGENGLHWGPFVFFGDKSILSMIHQTLENQVCRHGMAGG
jgi:hypothetical protein